MRHIALGLVAFTIACGGSTEIAPSPSGGSQTQCAVTPDPIRLAPATHPIALALDSENAYWIDDTLGTVNEVPLCGGATKTLAVTWKLGSQTLAPQGLAVDAGEVYFTTHDSWNPDPNGQVWKVSAAGGTPTKIVGHLDDPGPIAVTGANMVFVDSWGTYADDGQIIQSALDGSGLTVLASAQNGPLAIALGGGRAVWTTSGPFDSVGGVVFETPMGGGAEVDGYVAGQSMPIGIAVEGANLYWVDQGDPNVLNSGSVMTRPLDPNAGGLDPTTLASGGMPQGMAVDASNVYWTDSADQTVKRIPLAGGTPTTIATKQTGALAIAVDDANIYWATIAEGTRADPGQGWIVRLSK